MWAEYLRTCLYGIVSGVFLVVICLLYGFDLTLSSIRVLESILKRPLRKWSPRNRQKYRYPGREMLEGLTGNTRTIQPMQLSSFCTVYEYIPTSSWQQINTEGVYEDPEDELDDGASVSTARSTRKAAFSSTATGSRVNGGHIGAGVRCKIMLQNAEIRVYELLPSHHSTGDADSLTRDAEHYRGPIAISSIEAHRKKPLGKNNKGNIVPANRRIFLTSKDGGSLFSSSRRMEGHLDNNSIFGMSVAGSTLSGEVISSPSVGSAEQMNLNRFVLQNTLTSGALAAADAPSSQLLFWNSVMIEFSLPMEADKWLTVIEGLSEAESWREFVREMPNPDTFNLLVCRLFYPSIRRGGLEKLIRDMIRKKLVEVAQKKFPRFITGGIELDDFIIGTAFPWISDVSAPVMSTNGEIGFDMNLLYKGDAGGFVLYFKIALAYRGIRIPHFIVSIKLLEVQATLHISIGPPPSKKVWVGIHRPPILRVKAQQGCASGKGLLHRLLNSLPDMSGIICNVIRIYLFSEMILPAMDDFPLPSVEETPPNSPTHTKPKGEKGNVFDRVRAAQQSGRGASLETASGSYTTLQMLNVPAVSPAEISPLASSAHSDDEPVQNEKGRSLKENRYVPFSPDPEISPTKNATARRSSIRNNGLPPARPPPHVVTPTPPSSFFSFTNFCEDGNDVVGKGSPLPDEGGHEGENGEGDDAEVEPEEELEDVVSIGSSQSMGKNDESLFRSGKKTRPTAFHLHHFVHRKPSRRTGSQRDNRNLNNGSFAYEVASERAELESLRYRQSSLSKGEKLREELQETVSNVSMSASGVPISMLRTLPSPHGTLNTEADPDRELAKQDAGASREGGISVTGPSTSASVSVTRSKGQNGRSTRGVFHSRLAGQHSSGAFKHQSKVHKAMDDIVREAANMNQPAVTRVGDQRCHFGYAYGLRHRVGDSGEFSDDEVFQNKKTAPAHSCFCTSDSKY